MARLLVMVTGANGQVGHELRDLAAKHANLDFIFLSREDLPIHHYELVRRFFQARRPDVLINCAAYTAVDKAETEKELAFLVNGESVGVLAAVCHEYQTMFLHISTDYVFDGKAKHPYLETDPVSPVNAYGASKLEGEKQAFQYNPRSIIIRTSWVYSSHGRNFVKTMLRLMAEKTDISVVNDQVGRPTYAADLAGVLLQIAEMESPEPGIYHYSNHGVISWYDFAQAIAGHIKTACRIHPIPTSAYPTPAARPAYSVLDTSKIQYTFGVLPREWEESLSRCLAAIQA